MTAAELAHALSGYLCGTKRASPDLDAVAAAHAALPRAEAGAHVGGARWEPPAGTATLQRRLLTTLDTHGVVDLVFYGSQPRGTTTGFSDVDAALVIADEVAEAPDRLRSLRRHVLAAQRAVLAHQPMQHHGFDVVSPTLLAQGGTLALPRVAWSEAASLFGRGAAMSFAPVEAAERRRRFEELARGVLAARAWPRHVWEAHRLISMFELVPTLYVQALDRDVPKWESFDTARSELDADDWPFDDVRVVRETWPRRRRPVLEAAATTSGNPWLAVAAWRRLPAPLPGAVAELLTPSLLMRLHETVRSMEGRLR